MNAQSIVSHLGDLPWPKALVYGLVAAVAYYFLMFNDGSAIRQQLDSAGSSLTAAKRGLEQTKKAIADADKFEKEVARLQLEFKKIHDFMPENLGPALLTELVNKEAGTAGAIVTKLEPQSVTVAAADKDKGDFYDSSKMSVVLEGSFSQITKFFSNLSKLPRILVFEDLKLTQMPGPGDLEHPKLLMSGSLTGYRYKTGYEPGQEVAAKQLKPGEKPKPGPPATPAAGALRGK